MSVSLYAYEAWKCDGEYCCGDCDHCYKAQIEQDGWVTWNDISNTQKDVPAVHTGTGNGTKHTR
jgi:hypothetical protein